MGHDKAFIDYHGLAQYQWSADLLEAYCNEVYISVSERLSSKILKPTIIDRWKEAGPLAAIISAHLAYPEQDFFLLPCDMPYLNKEDLSYLVEAYFDASERIHCYKVNGYTNPLLAIWPASVLEQAAQYFEAGDRSPRLVMESLGFQAHFPLVPARLKNVNEEK